MQSFFVAKSHDAGQKEGKKPKNARKSFAA
jgi:hypothetical protein